MSYMASNLAAATIILKIIFLNKLLTYYKPFLLGGGKPSPAE